MTGSCPERASLDLLVDGELADAGARAELEAHLSECSSCRSARDDLDSANAALRATTSALAPPSPAEWSALLDRARRVTTWSWRHWLAAAALAIAVPAGLRFALSHRHAHGESCRCDLVAPTLDVGL